MSVSKICIFILFIQGEVPVFKNISLKNTHDMIQLHTTMYGDSARYMSKKRKVKEPCTAGCTLMGIVVNRRDPRGAEGKGTFMLLCDLFRAGRG